MELFKRYKHLSKQQQLFITNGGVTAEFSISKWIKFLEPICQYDERTDKLYSLVLMLLKPTAVITFGILFFGLGKIAFTDALLLLMPAISLGGIAYKLKKRDVNNNIRTTLYPLLHMMSLEVGNNKKVKLSINFNKSLDKQSFLKETTTKSTYGRDRNKFYQFNVLSMSCTLIDSSIFYLNVIDIVRSRARNNGRKVKTKHKLKRSVQVQITFNKTNYEMANSRVARVGSFKNKENKIVYKQVLKQSIPGIRASMDLQAIIDATTNGYANVRFKEERV